MMMRMARVVTWGSQSHRKQQKSDGDLHLDSVMCWMWMEVLWFISGDDGSVGLSNELLRGRVPGRLGLLDRTKTVTSVVGEDGPNECKERMFCQRTVEDEKGGGGG